MSTIIRRNERSWAIVIISEIRSMLKGLNIKIKSAGGESTLSVNKQSMFPDVLLYEDEAQNKILQGWELKMPDVPITDEALIKDATRKAVALGLNSFVIWNFIYGKLYVKNERGDFKEARVWSGISPKANREDVMTFKSEWLPIIKDIVLTVNEYLLNGTISASPVAATVSDGLMTEIIQRNKDIVAEKLILEVGKNMTMESRLKAWWRISHEEYDKDENNMYSAYAKSILLNWTNRIMFANTIKKYHNCAYIINRIDNTSTPTDGNKIIDEIIEQGDFYNVFKKLEYNEIIPEDTWIDIVDYNQFLIDNKIERVDQTVLQEILEKTVNTAKREIRGQYATPYCLADLLCQMTVHDWHTECADLCAGTGTIAKALIQNKTERIQDPEQAFKTTWVADKYAYPLQIANIAITSIEALNIPLNMFQADVFSVVKGQKIELKSPIDGSRIIKELPAFSAIVSNLPFIEYNKIAADEREFVDEYRQKIKSNTGIDFTSGKTDLYNYLPFKLHELLAERGRLGIILSNSWLGTDIGKKFFDALQYYYEIISVAVSDCKRWFQNADVVASILIIQKKEICIPDRNARIDFWLIKRDIYNLEEQEKEALINSIVLREEVDENIASVKAYSLEMIEKIAKKGISLNALFHDVSWVEDMADSLAPIEEILEVKRGERRGKNELFYPEQDHEIERDYIRPVLKKPASLKSFVAVADMEAFCCHASKRELEQWGHVGALSWIEKFENLVEGGKTVPGKLKRAGRFWYEMDDATKADMVTAVNPGKRLFVSKFAERTFVDQRFTRLLFKREDISSDLIHALLNSIYGMFVIEALGFGRGLGVLDASSTKFKRVYMIDPKKISKDDETEIICLFENVKKRNVMNVEDELWDIDREMFDRKVLQAIGHEELYEPIRKSLLSLQHTRHTFK